MQCSNDDVDVLIVGAGPVGLLTAYCLARYGVSTYVIEQYDRAEQSRHGRAAMIASRTLEMLDQLDLAEALEQIGFVVRGQVSYKNGEKVESLSYASSNISDTFFDFLLLCRQRYTEDVIREAYEKCSGRTVLHGARMLNFSISEKGHNTKVESIIDSGNGELTTISGRYLVGADGGHSKVRELAGIPFEGDRSNRHWIRIDGIVETNMPEARRGLCGIQSETHGSVLWACLDHEVTRVGFALPEKLWADLGANITIEDVIQEAKKALLPFTLEFKTVEWWTVYSVGQRLAATYRSNDRIFIAGDAAHTHSSGAAQGMNTGLHDAVNISWKLAGCINGWLTENVLDTYDAERRPIARKIIEQDKIISVLTGGEVPEQFKDDPEADPHKILAKVYEEGSSLNTGLGIAYPQDDITITASRVGDHQVTPGQRAPDILLQRPGVRVPQRLHPLIKSKGRFSIIFFCGNPKSTQTSLRSVRDIFEGPESWRPFSVAIHDYITIIADRNDAGSPDERLGVPSFGKAYYDVDGSAHERYGVSTSEGAVFVLRPDGMVGTKTALKDTYNLRRYFAGFTNGRTVSVSDRREDENDMANGIGEMSVS